MAKVSSNAATKGFNDAPSMMQHALAVSKGLTGTGSNPAGASGGYLTDIDPNLLPKENVPKKYTWKEVDEMLTDARYFIIKSSNQENINISRKYSEWATTRSNEVVSNYAGQTKRGIC